MLLNYLRQNCHLKVVMSAVKLGKVRTVAVQKFTSLVRTNLENGRAGFHTNIFYLIFILISFLIFVLFAVIIY